MADNIIDLDPSALRALAEQKERDALEARYMDIPAPSKAAPKPWEKPVEFEGETYLVDMRKPKSRKFLKMLADVQRASAKGGKPDLTGTLAMFDFVFAGGVDEQVERVVTEKMGYDDFQEILRIESALFELIDIKN